ncbi:MAG: threonine synthase, partial [Clostridia bacterium]|nr:threonine synthase [Clostridia bacterium]
KRSDSGRKIAILTATSGDTGKAALEGFRDADGIDIMVFFPEKGVSEIQKRQMITQEGKNVRVVAVSGNFDDAQTGVKQIFGDREFGELLSEHGWQLSSANSINFGRLLPQIVYYFHAYFALVRSERIIMGTKVNFVVPTGNFGDILAAYYAFKAGLPVGKLLCAANSNNVVSDFLRTGFYDANREFKLTISPAMDILISSNLERLIYDMSGEDEKATARNMMELARQGCYNVSRSTLAGITSLFWSDWSSEDETRAAIAGVWKESRYLIDPHTAVGIDVYDKYVISTGDMTPTVAVATASPFKFNRSVAESIADANDPALRDKLAAVNEFELLRLLSDSTGCRVPASLATLESRPVLHNRVCATARMKEEVQNFLTGSLGSEPAAY